MAGSTIIDRKPPVLGLDPPYLPPFLRKQGPERRRVIILPDITRCEQVTRLHDRENNWITLVYQWMDRVVGESLFDPSATWETAHTSTRRYRQWLETFEMKHGIPPHISFGGCIQTGTGDPTFHPRWREYARLMFA